MSGEAWVEIEEVFAAAAVLDPVARLALLESRCAGQPELRREVESLLSSHDKLGEFLRVGTVVETPVSVSQSSRRAQAGQIVGHYELVERVSAGSMGEVFRARDLALGRDAAVKLLPQTFSADLRRALTAEAAASARLQHPAIATFFEAGEADGETFIAMEFVNGRTLRERLHDGPIPFVEALAIARCLLEALAHAHAAGLLHRDIKPENVVLVDASFAKLVDFGIAAPIAALDAVPRAGTIGYLAPEQALGGPLDARTDLFQVGIVLYEMLTGRPAFSGESRAERLSAAITGSAQLDALDRVPMPATLPKIVQRALAHEPNARYESAAAFLRDIRILDDGPAATGAPRLAAVSDFENRTGNEKLNWLGNAVAESIHADLSGLANLRVVNRQHWARSVSSAGKTPADGFTAGLRLGCSWLVRGDVESAPQDQLRIVALVDEVATGRVYARHEVSGPLNALFDLQRTLASALAADLGGVVLNAAREPDGRTAIEAHECFNRGRRLMSGLGKGSLEDARHLLERAVTIDSHHVGALAALATTHGLRAIASPSDAEYELALSYADRALAIDPNHVPSLVWKSYALSALGRHDEAEAAADSALTVDPFDTEALYFAAGVRLFWREPPPVAESLALLQRAVERDERRGMWWLALGTAHACLGHHREALHSFTRAQQLEAIRSRFNTAGAAAYAGEILRRLRRLDEAKAAGFAGLEAAERSDHAYRDTFRAHALNVIGRTALDQRNVDAAEAAFQQVLAQARGRPQPRGCGNLVVQALCGLARATARLEHLDEAARLFQTRATFNFSGFYGALDADALLELALAAGALGRHSDAAAFLVRARQAGAAEPLTDRFV